MKLICKKIVICNLFAYYDEVFLNYVNYVFNKYRYILLKKNHFLII